MSSKSKSSKKKPERTTSDTPTDHAVVGDENNSGSTTTSIIDMTKDSSGDGGMRFVRKSAVLAPDLLHDIEHSSSRGRPKASAVRFETDMQRDAIPEDDDESDDPPSHEMPPVEAAIMDEGNISSDEDCAASHQEQELEAGLPEAPNELQP